MVGDTNPDGFSKKIENGREQIRTNLRNFLKRPGQISGQKFCLKIQPGLLSGHISILWCTGSAPLVSSWLRSLWVRVLLLAGGPLVYIFRVLVIGMFGFVCFILFSIPSLHFLTLLDYKESSRQEGSILELSSVDLNRFRTLKNANKQHSSCQRLGSEAETWMTWMTVKIRGLLDTKCLFTVANISFSVHVEDLPRSAAIFSQVVPIRTNFAKNWARSGQNF